MRIILVTLFASAAFSSLACSSVSSRVPNGDDSLVGSIDVVSNERMDHRSKQECSKVNDSVIYNSPLKRNQVTVRKLPGNGPASSLHFSEQRELWLGRDNELWKSNDDGHSWKLKERFPMTEMSIRFIRFASRLNGVVVLQRDQTDDSSQKLLILETGDGGETWNTSMEASKLLLTEVLASSTSWWVTGLRYGSRGYGEISGVVLKSRHGSQEWSDVLPTEKQSDTTPNFGIMGALSLSDGSFVFLNSSNSILRTADDGQTWRIIGEMDVRRIRLSGATVNMDGNIVVVGGISGGNGTFSNTIIFPINVPSTTCSVKYVLDGVYLEGVLSLSDGSIVALGFEKKGDDEEDVVLESNDDGANWSRIFKSKLTGRFVSFTKSDSDLLIITESGQLLSLRR